MRLYSPVMGSKSSKPESPLFDQPWRPIDWTDKQAALQYVNNYKPFTEGEQLRILLHGAVGAGKSSFINSVQNVLRGRMCRAALVDNTFGDSFTKEYKTYRIQRERPDAFYPFVLVDVMGLSADKGVLADDIALCLKGRVKDSYRFNPESKLSEGDQFYNEAPTDNDGARMLVCVIAADTLPTMTNDVKRKIRDIRMEASRLGIPQVAVLTKVDQACPEVKRDLKNVYSSKLLKNMMEQFSADVGIPMNCIFPVKNYHEEISLRDDVDCLILSVLKEIINSGDDFINMKLQTM